MRLLIRNGTLVGRRGRERHDILCEDGTIRAILDPGSAEHADESVDAEGLLVFPGFIDPHVHSRDPGLTHKEDFAHSTLAALSSGLTSILEMPNAVPPVTDTGILEERIEHHEQVAAVDFGVWGQTLGVTNIDDLPGLYAAGVVGIKLFWGYALDRRSGRLVYNTADADANSVIEPPSAGDVLAVFGRVARSGGLLAAHCEDRDVLAMAERDVASEFASYEDLLRARPVSAETTSIALAIEFARATGCRFHVVHLSSARGASLVRRARADGIAVSAEACAHYLTLTDRSYEELGPAMKVYPPVRGADERDALWDAIRDETICSVSSDHAPHAPDEKDRSLSTAPAGVHGVETLVPLMLDHMTSGRLSPERLADVMATGTAELYGIADRKGSIEVGKDADLTLVDPNVEFEIRAEHLHTKHKVSVFDGRRGRGAAVASILRGEVAMRAGRPVGERRGRFVPARNESLVVAD